MSGKQIVKSRNSNIGRNKLKTMQLHLSTWQVPEALSVLLQIADPKKLYYGSHWPFTPLQYCEQLLKQLNETPLLSDEVRAAAMTTNAYSLFARRLGIATPPPQL